MNQQVNNIKLILHKASSNRKLYVFIFCLFLATFFWLLNALSNNYTTEINFEVHYRNNPTGKVVLNELPNHFNIRVDALGYDLLAYKLTFRKPIVNIDLAQFKEFSADEKMKNYKVNSMAFSSLISNQLGNKIEIKSIAPTALYFSFDDLSEKLIKVVPVTRVSFKQQHKQFGKIELKPAVVKVSGPASVIDTLQQVFTEELVLNNLSQTFTASVNINTQHQKQKLTCEPNKILLHLPVEKFTESSVKIKVEYINVPDSVELKAIPDELEIKFLLPLSKIASLQSAVFKAKLDYNQDKSNKTKLEVELTEYPDFVELINKHPIRVEYIIKKK